MIATGTKDRFCKAQNGVTAIGILLLLAQWPDFCDTRHIIQLAKGQSTGQGDKKRERKKEKEKRKGDRFIFHLIIAIK